MNPDHTLCAERRSKCGACARRTVTHVKMSKWQLSIKEAFSAKRTAINEASQVILPPEYSEELFPESDSFYFRVMRRMGFGNMYSFGRLSFSMSDLEDVAMLEAGITAIHATLHDTETTQQHG